MNTLSPYANEEFNKFCSNKELQTQISDIMCLHEGVDIDEAVELAFNIFTLNIEFNKLEPQDLEILRLKIKEIRDNPIVDTRTPQERENEIFGKVDIKPAIEHKISKINDNSEATKALKEMLSNYADAIAKDASVKGVGYNVIGKTYEQLSVEDIEIQQLKSRIEFVIADSIWNRTLLEYSGYSVEKRQETLKGLIEILKSKSPDTFKKYKLSDIVKYTQEYLNWQLLIKNSVKIKREYQQYKFDGKINENSILKIPSFKNYYQNLIGE
jgi:uncharacterized protein YciU (UPF0263 family)